MASTKAKIAGAGSVGTILILIVLSGTLLTADYRQLLKDNENYTYILLDYDANRNLEIITRGIGWDEKQNFLRWKYTPDKWVLYSNHLIGAEEDWIVEYYRTYGEDRWVRLLRKPTQIKIYYEAGNDSITIVKETPYYASSTYGYGGTLIQRATITGKSAFYNFPENYEVLWVPSDNRMKYLHRLTWRVGHLDIPQEIIDNYEGEFSGVTSLEFGKNVKVTWKDASEQFGYADFDFDNDMLYVYFKEQRGGQNLTIRVFDPLPKPVFLPTDEGQRYGVYYTETVQKDGNILRYETKSPQNVFEDGGWKRKEGARSLMNKTGFSIGFIETDEDFDARVVDFNYTSTTVCLKSNELNKDIPFRSFNYNSSYFYKENNSIVSEEDLKNYDKIKDKIEKRQWKEYYEFELTKGDRGKDNKIKFLDDKEKCFTISFGDKIINKIFEFGFNSSEWQYQEDANETYCNSLDWSGASCAAAHDGNWDTFGEPTGGGTYAYLWQNYTAPPNFDVINITVKAHGSNQWEYVKVYCWNYSKSEYVEIHSFETGTPVTLNITLHSDCNNSKIQMKYECYNEGAYSRLYEEAMWWNITEIDTIPPDISFIFPTPANDTNLTQNNYLVNVSINEVADTVFLELTNTSGTINYTMTNEAGNWYNFNVTGQSAYFEYFYIYANDTSGNLNRSLARHINVKQRKIYDCFEMLIGNMTYYLDANITNSALYKCMNITANDVTLDCQGNTIDGDDTGTDYGIYITNTNTTVKNCNVSGWDYGIYLTSNNNTLTNNTVTHNHARGISLTTNKYNTLTNNIVYDNEDFGIVLSGSSNNTLINNTVNSNGFYGISLASISNYNILINNTINSNPYGLHIYSFSDMNNITGGSIALSSTYDYYFESANGGNTFTNTNFTASRKIYLSGTSWFNYRNVSNGIWLKNNVSTTTVITRTLVNWTQSDMRWNESANAERTANYNLVGLSADTNYNVYNFSVLAYTLTTDSSGNLPTFSINLNTTIREIAVVETITPPDTCTPTADANWNIVCSDNCTKKDGTASVKNITITGDDGFLSFDNYNVTYNNWFASATHCKIIKRNSLFAQY